jgi:hypothetical protein
MPINAGDQPGSLLEREARRYLPDVLTDLFGPSTTLHWASVGSDRGYDAVAAVHGSNLHLQLASSSRPSVIDIAARRLKQIEHRQGRDTETSLVVPYMTRAGEQAARERDLNWIDLAGNAHVFGEAYYVHVRGQPERTRPRGRPSSPFAPKSARIARVLLLTPRRWWRQTDLADETGLGDSQVSRVVRRLDEQNLLVRDGRRLRPRDPELLLDTWADDYGFSSHETVLGHTSGTGMEVAESVHEQLETNDVGHAFTGLPAAWLIDRFARFRLCSVYVRDDPNVVADEIGLRRDERGANVQLIFPSDEGVFAGLRTLDGLPCVSPVQTYLDLLHLPERAEDAAIELRSRLWHDD